MNRFNKLVYIIIFGCCILFLAYTMSIASHIDTQNRRVEPLCVVGTMEKQDGKMILRGHFDRDIQEGEQIQMYVHRVNVRICQNGKEIFFYNNTEQYGNYTSSVGTGWVSCYAPDIRQTDQIEIEIESIYNNLQNVGMDIFPNKLCVGDRGVLLQQKLRENMIKIMVSLLILIFGLAFMVAISTLQVMGTKLSNGYFACGILLVTGAICTFIDYDYVTLLFQNTYVVNAIDILTQILICYFIMIFFKNNLIKPRLQKLANALVGIWTAVTAITLLVQVLGFVDLIQVISIMLPYALTFVIFHIICVILDFKEHDSVESRLVLVSGVIMSVSAVSEIIHYYLTAYFWITLYQVGLLQFAIVEFYVTMVFAKKSIHQARRTSMMEQEVLQSKIAIMLSQIQPHFLYNSISCIQELCLQDPIRAHQALGQFAKFLRGNVDSLNSSELISFEQELIHIENYLYLEQSRFEDMLKVRYSIEVRNFYLPALSVQPIVENAVHYGVSKRDEGGTITIETREDALNIWIVVTDDGPGFDINKVFQKTKSSGGRSHVGITNVRNRIKIQCNGSVTVKSEEGAGTSVSIQLPKRQERIYDSYSS